ncbi:hypothetical protein llg_40830 [Luteolibacter sp. LG18]|nr:hypothetical protein llg_40830 [Luteolibacter sp. LG18]
MGRESGEKEASRSKPPPRESTKVVASPTAGERREGPWDEETKRRLGKLAQERTEAMREAGMLGKKGAPNYLLTGEGGRLTQQAMRDAGITDSQAAAVQGVLNRAIEEASREVAARARLIADESNPDAGTFVYRIPALPDGSGNAVGRMEEQIRQVVGAQAAEILLRSFDPNNYVCGFGKYDVDVTVHRSGANPTAEFSFTYPETSQVVRRGMISESKIRQYFGSALDLLGER